MLQAGGPRAPGMADGRGGESGEGLHRRELVSVVVFLLMENVPFVGAQTSTALSTTRGIVS